MIDGHAHLDEIEESDQAVERAKAVGIPPEEVARITAANTELFYRYFAI
ncbi:MAG: hypothetical protein ABFD97_24450 [Syntrophobacter sp.]